MSDAARQPASFRDPAGFLYTRDSTLFRQVNHSYAEIYTTLMRSGLYDELVADGLLIPHEEVDVLPAEPALAHKVLRPLRLPFISYPYEWCFSQLRDAALTTLAIEKRALTHGMSLKDCSAYNIQFHKGKPILIDSLSFESYREGEPWTAYRQFCQHFLGPLSLAAYTDVRLQQLLRVYIDGLPMDLVSKLLPFGTRLNPALAMHVHLHAGAQRRFADRPVSELAARRKMSRAGFLGLVENLESAVRGLSWEPRGTEWSRYYDETNYSPEAMQRKKDVVAAFIDRVKPASVWDLGANTGLFSRLAGERGIPTLAFDIDPAAVEKNYMACREAGETAVLPLVIDLTNPSPSLGWQNRERMSLLERGPADLVMALALVHHLAISNNVPLPMVAELFRVMGRSVIVEFVPKSDSQVRRLLASRADIFPSYTEQDFESEMGKIFHLREAVPLEGTERTLYLLESR